ncbi:MAG: hypothetical protein KDD22_03845 [Bdellovibrionales bacterium]|nr:hypothetical protein [Bdellovibrionales bacterium]
MANVVRRNLSLWGLGVLAGLTLLLGGPQAEARIRVTGVSGASNYLVPTENQDSSSGSEVRTNLLVFGGLAGPACTTTSTTETCDNCSQVSGLEKCNRSRIHPGLLLTISFQSDLNNSSGYPVLAKAGTDTVIVQGTAVTGPGSTMSISITWSELCTQLSGSNCSTLDTSFTSSDLRLLVKSSTDNSQIDNLQMTVTAHVPGSNSTTEGNLNLGCDDDNLTQTSKGICSFLAFPGDGKAYIDPINANLGYPTAENIQFSSVNFYLSKDNFPCSPTEGTLYSLNVSATSGGTESYQLTNKIIDGLDNAELYFVRSANVDQAGNISYFMDDSVINAACGLSYSCSGSRDVSTVDPECPYTVRPDEVLGLLTEDFNCFIATAAYGSPWDQRLNVLRSFRSKILQHLPGGKKFIWSYYKWGPFASQWIMDHPASKPWVRASLWPLWVFAWLSLKIGFGWAVTVFLLTLTTVVWALREIYLKVKSSQEPNVA